MSLGDARPSTEKLKFMPLNESGSMVIIPAASTPGIASIRCNV